MNFHGKDIKIFTANSNPMVAKRIAECLGLPLGKSEVGTFSDGEIAVSLFESVRGSDCFIVQSTCSPVQRRGRHHRKGRRPGGHRRGDPRGSFRPRH